MNVKVERVIPASPETVYRAWTERELLVKWLGGKKIIVNAVVDGLFYWAHMKDDGRDWPHYGGSSRWSASRSHRRTGRRIS